MKDLSNLKEFLDKIFEIIGSPKEERERWLVDLEKIFWTRFYEAAQKELTKEEFEFVFSREMTKEETADLEKKIVEKFGQDLPIKTKNLSRRVTLEMIKEVFNTIWENATNDEQEKIRLQVNVLSNTLGTRSTPRFPS
jgi:hypothetical protein